MRTKGKSGRTVWSAARRLPSPDPAGGTVIRKLQDSALPLFSASLLAYADTEEWERASMNPWLIFWIVIHIALMAYSLFDLFRKRHLMETRLVVKWVLLVVFVPVIGVIGYVFFLLDNAVKRGTPGRQDEAASFLRSPRQKDQ